MKKTSLVLASVLLASTVSTAQAKNYVFEAVDQTPETKICLEAAQNGYNAAKELAGKLNVRFTQFKSANTCNNVDIAKFAKMYNEVKTFEEVTKKDVKLAVSKEAKDLEASNACMVAAMGGEISDKKLTCNGKSITSFAKKITTKYNVVNASI